ncbi:MAG TPA: class I SAM-dependent rRNA methyltransferase [Candidatus Margulisiibacteriota bacterium]|nr:class I SAM-dependent rRNA methyltransferase [Candidatus Margulisiibacteriota bacterium]
MSEPIIHLKQGKERPVLLGHPWIFSGAIRELDPALPAGTLVRIDSAAGEFLGRGYANPRCAIAVRVLTRRDEPIDARFFHRRVADALALRHAILPADTEAYRLINGEGDRLPGFVADVYGPVVVLQCLTAGAAQLKRDLVTALQGALGPSGIYERSTGSVRREEGLEPAHGVIAGAVPADPFWVREAGHGFLVDVHGGQKTGFFLDQRDNRALAAQFAPGRMVLNAFAYTGAFSVYAGAAGARHVVSVESSARALDLARHNWTGNRLPSSTAEFVEADVFEYLRDTNLAWDLLILDPPALVKRRHEVERGARAYKDLHLWAFRRASTGAYVLTFSCSQHVPADLFWKIVHGAAVDARREVQALRHLGPGADHPTSLAHPGGEYLKGLLLRVAA